MWIITKGRGWKFRLKSLHQEITPAIRQFHFNHFPKIYKTEWITLNFEIILSTCKSQLRGKKSPREMYHRNGSLYIREIFLIGKKWKKMKRREIVLLFLLALSKTRPRNRNYIGRNVERDHVTLDRFNHTRRLTKDPLPCKPLFDHEHRALESSRKYVERIRLLRATRKDTPTGWN